MDDFALTHPEAYDEERLREHEADFTPLPVVRQCLGAAATLSLETQPTRLLDPAAGAGAWAKVMREMWPASHIWCIEKRHEEEEHLNRYANEVLTTCIFDLLSMWGWESPFLDGGDFDLIATNPPFSRFAEYADNLLTISPRVWLFAPVDACVRGEETSEWLAENAKYVERCLWVRGGIGFRGPGTSQDFRQYGLWMLRNEEVGDLDGWPVTLLPWLTGKDRRWVTRPGTEQEG